MEITPLVRWLDVTSIQAGNLDPLSAASAREIWPGWDIKNARSKAGVFRYEVEPAHVEIITATLASLVLS